MTVLTVGFSLTDALTMLADDCAALVAPVLDESELRRLIRVAAVNDVHGNWSDSFFDWAPTKSYGIGDRVVPRARNGYVYRATTSGLTASASPAWPVVIAATVTDGSVIWTVEDIAPWVPTYSRHGLWQAAAEGWRRKAGKLGNRPTLSAEGVSLHPEEQRNFFLEQAALFAKKGGVGTISLGRVQPWTLRGAVVIAN